MKKTILFLLVALIAFTGSAHKERWDDHKEGWSPLMLAIYHDQRIKVVTLIASMADVNFVSTGKHSNWHLSPLDIAIRRDNSVIVETLLRSNRVSQPETYLMTACAQKNARTIDLLIWYGANPNDTLENGYSVSMMAASFGTVEVLECLLKNGANLGQARKVDGMTTLMFAAFEGDVSKVELLLAHGADRYVKDNEGIIAFGYIDRIYDHLNVTEATRDRLRKLLK